MSTSAPSHESKIEREKSRWARLLQVIVPVLSVGVALASLLFTVASKKKELSCTLLASSSIVSVSAGINSDIRVEFRGQPVNALSKQTFSLKNTGAAAIRADDVKEPIRLTFPSDYKILTALVEGTSPQRFTFSVKLDPSTNSTICEFPLLNSGDEAVFSIYVQSTREIRPSFDGRVVDVSQMLFVDRSEGERSPVPKFLSSNAVRRVVRWVLVVVYFGLAGAAVVVLIVSFRSQLKYVSWARLNQKKLGSYRVFPSFSDTFDLRKRAIEKNVNPPPFPAFNSVGEALGVTLIALSTAGISVVTAMIIFAALRG